MNADITEKQRLFNAAMEKYEKMAIYKWAGFAVSIINVGGQVLLAALVFRQPLSFVWHALVFAAAYVLADLINGLVHMYSDNSEDYTSPAGPFIAAFHLHHRTPAYKIKPLPVVYFHESGSKVWLAVFTLAAVPAVWAGYIKGAAAYGIFYFSVLSSIAELSHYLCHVPFVYLPVRFLRKLGLLMSHKYHVRHHRQDNVSYAFLNAMTDPLIDIIAKKYYKGYKATTDTHYGAYAGQDTENRR